ncbi:MAG: PKD domain-containing protein [Thermomicrobiales bacterium]
MRVETRQKIRTAGSRWLRMAFVTALVLALIPFHAPGSARAEDATVSTCTAAGFEAALDEVQGSGGGIIVFDCTGTIVFEEQMVISSDVTIFGNGTVTFDGAGSTRFFRVDEGAALRLVRLTLQNGGGTVGGAIHSTGADVTVISSTFVDNSVSDSGGAIWIELGTLRSVNSTFAGNVAGDGREFYGYGGAIFANGTTMQIDASTFNGNHADEAGGSIDVAGVLTIAASTFSNNTAGSGGAIRNLSELYVSTSSFFGNSAEGGGAISDAGSTVEIDSSTFIANSAANGSGGAIGAGTFSFDLTNSTFVGNTASEMGGAIASSFQMSVAHSTLTGNVASEGGAITGIGFPQTTVSTSILAGNIATTGQNCGNSDVISQGFNLTDDSSCSFTATGDVQNSSDINLNALASNGGPTQTMLPMANSDAIDNADCQAPVDQRGAERPLSGCDVGAVEVGGAVPVQISAFESLSPPLDEGQSAGFLGVAYGPDNSDLSYALDCDNDGVYETAVAGNGNTVNGSCVLPDDGLLTIGLRVCDGGDASNCDTATTEITAFNVSPSIEDISEDGPVNEGSPVSISVDAGDPGVADILTYSFDCDENGSYETAGTGSVGQCLYADEGLFVVGVKVEDDDGGIATDSIEVEAVNAPPVVDTPIIDPAPSNEGDVVIARATFSDPGTADTHTCTVDYGDGSGPHAGTINGAFCSGPPHTYLDDEPSGSASDDYTVEIVVTDDEGDSGGSSVDQTVNNLPPEIIGITTNGPAPQGQPAEISVAAADAGVNDVLSYRFDCDVDGNFEVGPQPNADTTCTLDPAAATTTIGVEVSDDDLGVTTGSVDVEQTVTLCGSIYTGAMSVPRDRNCPGGTMQIVLPAAYPVTVCVNSYTGVLTMARSQDCYTNARPHVVPVNGPLFFCANTWTGQIRHQRGLQACSSNEIWGVIPG